MQLDGFIAATWRNLNITVYLSTSLSLSLSLNPCCSHYITWSVAHCYLAPFMISLSDQSGVVIHSASYVRSPDRSDATRLSVRCLERHAAAQCRGSQCIETYRLTTWPPRRSLTTRSSVGVLALRSTRFDVLARDNRMFMIDVYSSSTSVIVGVGLERVSGTKVMDVSNTPRRASYCDLLVIGDSSSSFQYALSIRICIRVWLCILCMAYVDEFKVHVTLSDTRSRSTSAQFFILALAFTRFTVIIRVRPWCESNGIPSSRMVSWWTIPYTQRSDSDTSRICAPTDTVVIVWVGPWSDPRCLMLWYWCLEAFIEFRHCCPDGMQCSAHGCWHASLDVRPI